MIDAEIKYEANVITGEILANMRNVAGWGYTSISQAEAAVKNTPFSVAAFSSNKVVGIGRIIGDGALIWYIQDVIVLPEYQNRGIGTTIMNRLIKYAKTNSVSDDYTRIGLMSAIGKEQFYEKFGFIVRPYENQGAGMTMNIKTV